jgi:hypothetical protein
VACEVLGRVNVPVGEYIGKGTSIVKVITAHQYGGPMPRHILSLTLRSR